MTEREFFLPSSDGTHKVRCLEWIPDGEVTAVLQIVHGMIEHIGRYREFGIWLAERGIAVIGHDHLGHGKTVNNPDEYGYFGHENGTTHVIKDIRRVTLFAKKKYQGKKFFVLGHSMGSFLTRKYISVYPDGPDGFILMGTGAPADALVLAGYALAENKRKTKGDLNRSSLLYELSLGNYNRKFKPVKTKCDWLTRDEWFAQDFDTDELCQFVFTSAAYSDFFRLIYSVSKNEKEGNVRNDMPMLIVSGDKDPVGDDGKGVQMVYERYHKAGVKDLAMELYENARHELLHETNRLDVFEDLFEWLKAHC